MPARSVLLQCPGDPFILRYWLRNYELWRDEVNELRVFVNGTGEGETLDWCRQAVERAGGIFTSQPGRLVHGQATEILLHQTQADYALLIEDDAFVRFRGAVDLAFDTLESGHWSVLGSPRGGMCPEVEVAAIERWGSPQPVGPDGSVGYGLWPSFLLASVPVLRDVAHGMSSLAWNAGQTIPGLNWTPPKTVTTDTATAAAFMLRDRFPEGVFHVGQWKELWMKRLPEMQELAGYDPPWFHSGGLSNELFFQGGRALGSRPGLGGTNEGLDWAHRIWWWRRCVDTFGSELPELQATYRSRLDDATAEMGIEAEVASWDEHLPPWITWDEEKES